MCERQTKIKLPSLLLFLRIGMADAQDAPAPESPTAAPVHRYFYGRRDRKCAHDPRAIAEGALQWLSNFRTAPIVMGKRQLWFKSSEHYYQWCKFKSTAPEHAEAIRLAPTATKAKQLGNSKRFKLRANWADKRLAKMRKALRAKFTQHPELAAKLLATGDAQLHEDAPDDRFYGVCGEDHLGKLLCEQRAGLRAAQAAAAAE
jgi:ribA/ribD-fused uncharacterized protein